MKAIYIVCRDTATVVCVFSNKKAALAFIDAKNPDLIDSAKLHLRVGSLYTSADYPIKYVN